MDEQSWRGEWWVSDESDETRDGTLYCADDGRLRLELIGGFDVDIRTPLPDGSVAVGMESRDFPMIHGVCGGDLFTLLGSHATHTSGGFLARHIVQQDISPNRALLGIHLTSPDEPVFTRSHLQLERLLPWTNRSTIDYQLILDQDGRTTDRKVGTHAIPTVTASYNNMEFALRVRSHEFNIIQKPVSNRRLIESMEWAVLDFESPEPVSYDAFDTVDKDIQDLLTLCAYEACGSLGQSLIYTASESHPGHREFPNEVKVLGRHVYQTPPQDKEKPHHNYLFTLDDLDFPDLVPRWLALKDRARMGCNVLFGLRYIGSGYVGTRLLGVASAAENLHRSLRTSSTPLTQTRYRELKKKLLAAISDEDEAAQTFVREGLRNHPSYKERMLDLVSIPDPEAVDRLLTDRERWATMLRDARNDMAHANERSSDDPDTTPAFWLLEITYAMLCLVIVAELGLSAEVQRRVVDHPQVAWAANEFRKALAATPTETSDDA